jgi:phospholipid/cholesterol/gamma-HCH transport system ATP-binding protein
MNSPSTPPPLVELHDLTFGYGDRVILKNLSFNVPRGQVTALMGVSGGGKTTVLRLIGGQIRASQGQLTDMSVFDNVAFPLREHTRLSEDLIRDIVLMKLDAVGLRGARDLKPSEISGGMSRRVALARAIALDPDLIMYDEPFAGLDPISLGTAARLIRRLNDSLGITSIVVSHDVTETFEIADHVVILAHGGVAAQGTPAEMRASTDPLIYQFVHALSDGPVPFHYPAPSTAQDYDGRSA